MSTAMFYKWRAKFGGMDASMMKRLKELEDENRRLKKMYAEELLVGANAKPTSHKKIMRAYEPFIKFEALNEKLMRLSSYIEDEDLDTVMQGINDIVPDYVVSSKVQSTLG